MSFEIGLSADSRHVKSLKKHNLHLFKLKMSKSIIKKGIPKTFNMNFRFLGSFKCSE